MTKFFLLLIFVLNSLFLFSQDTTSIFDLSLEELLKLKTKSVSKIEESALKAPQTIIIITDKELLQRGYSDIEQVLHDLPGFDISRGNGTQYSQIYQRGYRSNNTERTLLLIDGVEENDLWSNSVWLSRQYPISNIKRIEIIYGPASSVYGANAFAGVINIVTKTAGEIIKNENNFGINAQIGYGNWKTKYTDITLAQNFNKINFVLTGRYYYSDEMDLSKYDDWDYDLSSYNLDFYKNILNTDNNNIAQTALELDKQAYFHDYVLNGILPHYSNTTKDWLINGKLNIENFTMGFQTFVRNEGYGAWYRDDFELGPENGGRWVPKNSFFFIKYSYKLSNTLQFTSFSRFKQDILEGKCEEFYYIGYLNGNLSLSNLIDSVGNLLPINDITKPYWWHGYYHTFSQQFRTEFQLNYEPTNKLTWNNILEIRKSHIQGDYFISSKKIPEETAPTVNIEGGNYFYSSDYGLYSHFSYLLAKNLLLILGANLNYNKIRIYGGYGMVFNPKTAIIFSPKNLIFKFIYSKAFQDASYWTKYGTTPGRLLNNPKLKPEKVNNFEFDFSCHINKNIFFTISAFNAFYNGSVTTVNATYVNEFGDSIRTTQHQAIAKYNIKGIEARIRTIFRNFSFYANYSFLAPYSTSNDKKIRIGDIASNKANIGINYLIKSHLNLNFRVNYIGVRPTGKNTTISDNPLNQINPYCILNGAISYTFAKKFTLQILLNNILNKEYFDPGVRNANGTYYAAEMPQNSFNFLTKFIINF